MRIEVSKANQIVHHHASDVMRAQPVRTRAQARLESEEGNIEAPSPSPHISTSSDIFAITLDNLIRTIRVQIGTSDIVKQHTQAIVNPANSHLNHFGGVVRAIADAAGNDLISECETYKQTHGLLPTASVTHTTTGKLRPHIDYVVHTVRPRDVDYVDKDELQTVLTKTYYSEIKYASEILRIPTLSLPAISSGIFQVKLESVVLAFYTALKQYTDDYSRTSHTPILHSVRFVINSQSTTVTAASIFQELYTADRPPPVQPVTRTPIETPAPQPRPSDRQADHRSRSNQLVEERIEI